MKEQVALGAGGLCCIALALVLAARSPRSPFCDAEPGTPLVPISEAAEVASAVALEGRAGFPPESPQDLLLASIEMDAEPDHAGESLDRAAESVPEPDLPSTLDSLTLDARPGAFELRQLLIRRWAEIDAAAAAAWALRLPEGPDRRGALEHVAIAWAQADLPAVQAWVQALPPGDSKRAATLALAYEIATSDAPAGLELAAGLDPARDRDDLLVHVLSQWTGTDPAAAAAWAEQAPDPKLRERLVATVAIAAADQDAPGAAALAAGVLGAGEELSRATVCIVQRWAQKSPETAAAWIAQFPDIPSRDAAVENLLASWTAQDASAAASWAKDLPAGALREMAMARCGQPQ